MFNRLWEHFFNDKQEIIECLGKNVSSTNWVNVLIWAAKDNQGQPSTPKAVIKHSQKHSNEEGGNVGHAAVQTAAIYASQWPGKVLSGIKTPVNNADNVNKTRTYAMDIKDEGGSPPDSTITFFSLNKNEIEKEYIKNKYNDYVLKAKGNPKLDNQNETNCSGMAYKLLKAGGINKLSSKCKSLESSWSALTPNDLSVCIKDAKKRELELFPHVNTYPPLKPG